MRLAAHELSVIPYSHTLHYERVKEWLWAKGMRMPEKCLFSDLGFMVDGIAVGFLYLSNSRQAFIDQIAADPTASEKDRDAALRFLFKSLEGMAKECGCVLVKILSDLPKMQRRLETMTYTKHGDYGLYYKVLEGDSQCLG